MYLLMYVVLLGTQRGLPISVIGSIKLLTREICGPRGSHIDVLWMLVDLDILIRVFVKVHMPNVYK